MAHRRDHNCVVGACCRTWRGIGAGELSQSAGAHRHSLFAGKRGRRVRAAAQWNASIIVESKSGANGSIAAEEVARSAPDGYTWLLVTTFFTASSALDAKLRWGSGARFHPDRPGVPGSEFLHRAHDVAGEERGRVCGAGQGETGHAELQPSGHGIDRASRVRAVQASNASARRCRPHWRQRTCGKSSTSPDASRRARRRSSSPTSSRPMSRCGRRSSRTAASQRIEPGAVERSARRLPVGERPDNPEIACAAGVMMLRVCSPWGSFRRI